MLVYVHSYVQKESLLHEWMAIGFVKLLLGHKQCLGTKEGTHYQQVC